MYALGLRSATSFGRGWRYRPSISSHTEYQYATLQDRQIRLVILHPHSAMKEHSPLRVNITIENLNPDLEFEALSYAWGDATDLHPLDSSDGLHHITTNLRDALINIRPADSPRRLWIDALCINQQDEKEKEQQIALMRQIYGTAKSTIIWLGEEADDAEMAVFYFNDMEWRLRTKLAEYLNARLPIEDMSTLIGDIDKSFGQSLEYLFQGFDRLRTQRAIAKFLARPWFRRAWVVQEFVVSNNVQMRCGDMVCTWAFAIQTFMYAFEEAQLSWHGCIEPSDREHMFQGVQQMLQMHQHANSFRKDGRPKGGIAGLFKLLQTYRAAQTSMPEDKVWSLLGFLQDSGTDAGSSIWMQDLIQAISGKAKKEMYTNLACLFVDAGKGEVVLNEAAKSSRNTSEMCSWVPDWSELPTSYDLSHILGSSDWFFTAGGSKAHEAPGPFFHINSRNSIDARENSHLSNTPILCTRGAITHDILFVGKQGSNLFPHAPKLSHLFSIMAELQNNASLWPTSEYITGEDFNTVQSFIISAGQSPDPTDFARAYREFSWDILAEFEFDDVPSDLLDPHTAQAIDMFRQTAATNPQWTRNVARLVAGRTTVICADMRTYTPYMGLVPMDTREGDKIAILQTCTVPYVLRSTEGNDGSDGRFTLVGDCYIHGIMGGELVDGIVWEDIELV